MSPVNSYQSSRDGAGLLALSSISPADAIPLAPRLRAGTVLWDLRPLHDAQRMPVAGAVNLGQVDWLVEDRSSGQLQPPSVIAKILARIGIVPGCAVLLYAGSRTESLGLARRALLSIGVDQVDALGDDDEATATPFVPHRCERNRAEAVATDA